MTREEAKTKLDYIRDNYGLTEAQIKAIDMAIEALSMQSEMMDDATLLVKHEGWEDVKRIFLTDEAGLFGMYFYVAEQMVEGDGDE